MNPAETRYGGQPGLVPAALFALCPRCGAKGLFAGVTKFAPACRSCGLDFASFNVGDGPAAFLTFLVGGLITGLAIWLELSWHPPFWVHAVLWIPLTTLAVIGGLRAGKAALLAVEFQRPINQDGAGEGQLKE